MTTPRIVVGITGASGAAYAQRVLSLLAAAECEVHLIISKLGRRLISDELGISGSDIDALIAMNYYAFGISV